MMNFLVLSLVYGVHGFFLLIMQKIHGYQHRYVLICTCNDQTWVGRASDNNYDSLVAILNFQNQWN